MTTNITQLIQPSPPWLVRTSATVDCIMSAAEARGQSTIAKVILDGSIMGDVDGLLQEFGVALRFPDYYGSNSAALQECMTDLEWLPADGYLLFLTDAGHLLKHEPQEMPWLIGLLSEVCEEWSHPVALGESWDRPAKPFHVVFQYRSNDAPLPAAIAALPIVKEF